MNDTQQPNPWADPQIMRSVMVMVACTFIILVIGFSLLVEDLRLGFIIAMFLGISISVGMLLWFFGRSTQRNDSQQGQQDYQATIAPLVQLMATRLESLEAEAREDRNLMRQKLIDREAPAPFQIAAPARAETVASAPRVAEASSAPMATKEMPPQLIHVTNDLVVEETDRGDEIRFSVNCEDGESRIVRFSRGLIQTFLLTQYPEIRQDNWRRDDHQYGNTARMLQALGPIVPAGRGWAWNTRIKRDEVEHWWNGIVKSRVFGNPGGDAEG